MEQAKSRSCCGWRNSITSSSCGSVSHAFAMWINETMGTDHRPGHASQEKNTRQPPLLRRLLHLLLPQLMQLL